EAEEKILAAAEPVALHWQFDLWQKLRAQKAAPELFAFTLMRLASSQSAFARLRHFDDAAVWSYFERGLTRPAVKSLLERVAANADVYKRYQKLRADHVGKSAPPRFTI